MRIQDHPFTVDIITAGFDYQDYRYGIQLAIDGQPATMFDLHKSKIREVGDNTDRYERVLIESATGLLRQYGPQRVGVPPASPR